VRSRTDDGRATDQAIELTETGRRREKLMLYTIAVVLLILWALGLVTSYTLGGVIHLLLVVAIVMVLINFISGRRAL
jgi:hypothetical protein